MQPNRLDAVVDDVLHLPSVSDAREAWFRGEFDVCLDLLDRVAPLNQPEQREALLLRARALLRIRHAAGVVALLGPALNTFVGVDEACTARMLHGEAIAKTEDVDRGLSLLLDLYTASFALNAHTAIRGEIAYKVALAYWMKRDYRPTLEYATIAEAARADIISVRASFLRGFVAAAKQQYHQALALFKASLQGYRSCRERDQDLLELIVVQIAALEVALRSARVHGTHDLPGDVGTRMIDVHKAGPGTSRMQLASLDAWLFAFDGDRDRACRLARIAVGLAPNGPWRVWALANRAQVALCFGDIVNAREFAAEAVAASETVQWDDFDGEERVTLLLLAEALAVTDPQAAVSVMKHYECLAGNVDKTLLMHDEVRLRILETFVRGLVFRINGDMRQAWQAFKEVYATAMRVGILWRAAAALIELDATPIAGRPSGDHYLQAATLMVRENFPRSFLGRRLGMWRNSVIDPVAAALAPRPREVMRHLLSGRNPKEIAAAMGLAEGTVQTYVKGLHSAFAVHSTPELLVACYRRGIGDPSWWNVLDRPGPPAIPGERTASPKRRTKAAKTA